VAQAAARRQEAAEGLAEELASPSPGVSRYAQLAADLPRLAAQVYGKQTSRSTSSAPRPRPIPSRDLAPLPLPGQLTIPVDERAEGVVVAIDTAGSRRRRD
jgi:hypothetical protein